MESKKPFAFAVITSLFFLWGFTTVNNDILIPYYKNEYQLSDAESMLVNLSFFGSYGIWATIYYLISRFKGDLLNRIGYKNGIVAGLFISAFACFLYYPITYLHNFNLALIPLFLLGMGFTILQISCNPYVSILGPPEGASTRLNLSQGFNSLGTTIGPMLIGFIILSYLKGDEAVQIPYGILAGIFGLIGLIIWQLKLPEPAFTGKEKLDGSALQFRHLALGMIAVFFYVGAEVAIGSKLIEYVKLPEITGMNNLSASAFVGIYWGGAMIGRLTVSVVSSDKYLLSKKIMYGLLTAVSTFVFLLVAVSIATHLDVNGISLNWEELKLTFGIIYPILYFIGAQFLFMILFRNSSRKLLTTFSLIIIALLITAFFVQGTIAMWCIVSIGLFNSIMWSNIFTLAIADLKEFTSQGSSLLIIMIVGGAIIPFAMGVITDKFNLMIGYLLPIISYIYIAYYGIYGSLIKNPNHE